jgi:hypothetical protein
MENLEIHNLDGVDWCSAPPPPAKHEHWAQTWAWYGPAGLSYVERCPCGAFGDGGGRWSYIGSDTPRVVPEPRSRRIWAVLTVLCVVADAYLIFWGLTAPELNGRAVLSFIGFAGFAFLATEFHNMWKS